MFQHRIYDDLTIAFPNCLARPEEKDVGIRKAYPQSIGQGKKAAP